MSKTIEEIASQHLGKAGDGTVVKPYVTPTKIDPTLLVSVPRSLNRTQYSIKEGNLPFVGVDVWNAYEFSTLTKNGYPVTGHIKITYPANSHSIVESKSLKLYLNSYNMVRVSHTREGVITEAQRLIQEHLTELLGPGVHVEIFSPELNDQKTSNPFSVKFDLLERKLSKDEFDHIIFDKYKESPELLRGVELTEKNLLRVSTSVLRSNCRVTNQPDWGDVFISMTSNYEVDMSGLLQYLVSIRSENHFHEEVCEMIYARLLEKFTPDDLFVACLYTRRGGIDINPVRATNHLILSSISPNLINPNKSIEKTWRQ